MGYKIGYDIKLSEYLAIGCLFSMNTGVLTKVEYDDGTQKTMIDLEEGSYEGLSRIDILFGLRYYF